MALFAHGLVNGDEINHGAGFEAEAYVGGNDFDPSKGDDGVSVQTRYWYKASADSDTLVISNYTGETLPAVPDIFTNDISNAKYLHLDTSSASPLFRSAKPNAQSTAFEGVGIGDGIYLDTLVKFTAADAPFEADLTDGDKIAIEYVDQTTDDTIDNPIKGFVIRAGRTVGEDFGQANYLADAPDGFDVNEWHRLTVRSIADVGDRQVGFVIYLDGDVNNPLAYDTEFEAGFGTLDQAVAEKFYNDSLHALYPSAVNGGDDKTNISAVSFSGTGCIDDVVLTTTTPNFIQQGESVVVSFVADAGVTEISVEVKGDVVTNIAVTAAGTYAATLEAQTADFTVNVTVDEAGGYTFGSMTVGDAVYNTNPASVTGYADGDITITTTRNNFNLFDADGEPIEGKFQTLTKALAEDDVAMIKLAHDYDVAENEVASFVTYAINNNVTLDLNGKTITAVDTQEDVLFTVGAGAELVVIDSVGGGAIDYDTEYGVFGGEGDTIVGATSGDFGPTIIGPLLDAEEDPAVLVVRAKLDGEGNSDTDDSFAFEDYIAKGSDVSDDLVNGYWVVEPEGGSTTFALTTTGGENAEIVTDPANVSALTEATDVTITATATNGFTYATVDLSGTDWSYNSNDDAISMTTNISENTTVVVPDAVSEQSQEDWPEGEDLIAAEGKAAGDLFPGITNTLATADAKAVATWAEANNVAYAAKGSILPEAFLLNCANTQAAIDEAAANFKVTAITVVGDTVTITPADGADYGNGKVVIEGTATLSPISWHEKTDGDHFFRATLVVKPVTP